jgi:hypothetical protein
MSQLLPPHNVRRVTPRVCAMCRDFRYDPSGYWECLRTYGNEQLAPIGDTCDGRQYETTCDRWQKYKEQFL